MGSAQVNHSAFKSAKDLELTTRFCAEPAALRKGCNFADPAAKFA